LPVNLAPGSHPDRAYRRNRIPVLSFIPAFSGIGRSPVWPTACGETSG